MTVKSRTRRLLVSSFAVMLGVVIISAVVFDRRTQATFAEINRIQQDYQESERLLLQVLSSTNEIAILVRDYLLETAHNESLRQQIADLDRSIDSKLNELQQRPGLSSSEPLDRLKEDLTTFRKSMDPIFDWTPQERAQRGTTFLRRNVVPFRENVLSVSQDLQTLVSGNMSEQRKARSTLQDVSRRSFLRTVILSVACAALFAVFSIRRLSTLEKHAAVLQLKTEQDSRQMRHLSQKLVRAQEQERRLLSRELHDQIGQMLTGIQMEFNNLRTLRTTDAKAFDEHFHSGTTLIERTLSAVRDMARGLRPSMLDDFGLAPALEWQGREFSRRSGIPVYVQIDGSLDDLSEEVRTCLFRVAQEALTNCARHSEATEVRMTVNRGPGIIVLTIQDNGKGFHPDQDVAAGLGLLGIQERVRELAGRVSVLSQPHTGTLLRIQLPVSQGKSET
jgi:signal transduction histidine kinase